MSINFERLFFGRRWIRPRSKTNSYANRDRFPDFMEWIKTFACLICGTRRRIDAAHTGESAGWRKADDRTCLPLCHFAHHQYGPLSIHKLGRPRFWEFHGLDPRSLWAKFNGLYLQVNPNFAPLEIAA